MISGEIFCYLICLIAYVFFKFSHFYTALILFPLMGWNYFRHIPDLYLHFGTNTLTLSSPEEQYLKLARRFSPCHLINYWFPCHLGTKQMGKQRTNHLVPKQSKCHLILHPPEQKKWKVIVIYHLVLKQNILQGLRVAQAAVTERWS